jgi:Uma2 family endonuclease
MSIDVTTLELEYPSSDGQPMAETEIHILAIIDLLRILQRFFRPKPDIYVIGDMFWYWNQGVPADRVAPDVMIVPDVGRANRRRSFFSWKEHGAIPHTVFEFASQGTWQEDLDEKFTLYERLEVKEYFLFDPEGLYLRPALQGYRLAHGKYRPMRPSAGYLMSDLGFGIATDDIRLRILDRTTGQIVLSDDELVEEKSRLAEEKTRLAEEKTRLAEEKTRLAEQERLRAEAMRVELERVQAELMQLKRAGGTSS